MKHHKLITCVPKTASTSSGLAPVVPQDTQTASSGLATKAYLLVGLLQRGIAYSFSKSGHNTL